jgi:hypothetical protein
MIQKPLVWATEHLFLPITRDFYAEMWEEPELSESRGAVQYWCTQVTNLPSDKTDRLLSINLLIDLILDHLWQVNYGLEGW